MTEQTGGVPTLALRSASADPQTILQWAEFYAFTMRWVIQPIHKYMGLDHNGRKVCSCELTGKKWPRCSEEKPGKHPWTGWNKHPMDTPEQGYSTFRSFFDQYPYGVNIGVRTGKASNIWALDLDMGGVKNGVASLEKWLTDNKLTGGDLQTLVAKTGGGGYHYVFSYPGSVDKIQTVAPSPVIGSAVDIKGDGGYILVAPSVHASGTCYAWQNEISPASVRPAPDKAVAAVQKKKRTTLSSHILDIEYTPSLEELREYADSLTRKKSANQKTAGKNLLEALDGKAVAGEGARHTTYRNIVFHIRREWPRSNRDEILDFLEDSIHACFPDADSDRLLEVRGNIGQAFDDASSALSEKDEQWINSLSVNDNGKPIANDPNIYMILKNHPAWRGSVGFNLRRNTVVYRKKPPLLGIDTGDFNMSRDKTKLALWMQETVEMAGCIQKEHVHSAALAAAYDNPFDPLIEYVNRLRGAWDGVQRLATAMQRVAGTPDNEWTRLVFPTWFRSLVARILEPGCKVDTMLILEGNQGFKKSSFFANLLPDVSYFSDSITHARLDKETIRLIHSGPAIFELGELSGLKKQEVEEIKAFLSAFQDDLEPKYEMPRSALRRFVAVGTTNRNDYLRDETGARRFWPLRVTRVIDIATVLAERDQWFAEALAFLEAKWPWWLNGEAEVALAEAEQDERYEEDIWEEPIRTWLDHKAQPQTKNPTTATEQMSNEANKQMAGDFVTTLQVAQYALKLEIKNARSIEGFRINKCLKRLGWQPWRHREASGRVVRSWRRP